jgi:flavin-binding protein dodecin
VRDQPLAGFLQLLNVTVRHGTNWLRTQVRLRQNTMSVGIGSTEAAGVLKVVGIGAESSPPNRCIDQTAKVETWTAGDASLTRNGCPLLELVPSGACSGAGAKEGPMSIVKMVELSAQSPDSWEEATRQAVERAARTLRNIRSVWVKEFEAVVENEQVTQFRVILKIAFQLDEGASARSTRSMGDEEILGLD